MSNNKWVECDLVNATHVEINGEVHEMKADGKVKKASKLSSVNFRSIDILIGLNVCNIHVDLFPILGIKCLRKVKPKPIEFEVKVLARTGSTKCEPYLVCSEELFGKKFKCVEILEEE